MAEWDRFKAAHYRMLRAASIEQTLIYWETWGSPAVLERHLSNVLEWGKDKADEVLLAGVHHARMMSIDGAFTDAELEASRRWLIEHDYEVDDGR